MTEPFSDQKALPRHPPDHEYFTDGYPQLFHAPDGSYLIGLAGLFGAHLCGKLGEVRDHDFVDSKCAVCGTRRRYVGKNNAA